MARDRSAVLSGAKACNGRNGLRSDGPHRTPAACEAKDRPDWCGRPWQARDRLAGRRTARPSAGATWKGPDRDGSRRVATARSATAGRQGVARQCRGAARPERRGGRREAMKSNGRRGPRCEAAKAKASGAAAGKEWMPEGCEAKHRRATQSIGRSAMQRGGSHRLARRFTGKHRPDRLHWPEGNASRGHAGHRIGVERPDRNAPRWTGARGMGSRRDAWPSTGVLRTGARRNGMVRNGLAGRAGIGTECDGPQRGAFGSAGRAVRSTATEDPHRNGKHRPDRTAMARTGPHRKPEQGDGLASRGRRGPQRVGQRWNAKEGPNRSGEKREARHSVGGRREAAPGSGRRGPQGFGLHRCAQRRRAKAGEHGEGAGRIGGHGSDWQRVGAQRNGRIATASDDGRGAAKRWRAVQWPDRNGKVGIDAERNGSAWPERRAWERKVKRWRATSTGAQRRPQRRAQDRSGERGTAAAGNGTA